MLNYNTYGDASAPLLVIAHGLFGSARNWRAIAKRLGHDNHVVVVDMRNHGSSFHSDQMRYEDMAADLAEIIGHFDKPAHVLGHSMGGKATIVLALRHPKLLRSVLVADIAPVSYTHAVENLEYISAMNAIDLDKVSLRKDADAQLAKRVGSPQLRAFLLQSLILGDEPPRWAFNLSVLERNMEQIVGFPDLSGSFKGPALLLDGEDSTYVDDVGKAAMRALMPNARFASLRGASHWLHAQKPRAFIESVQAFLRAVER